MFGEVPKDKKKALRFQQKSCSYLKDSYIKYNFLLSLSLLLKCLSRKEDKHFTTVKSIHERNLRRHILANKSMKPETVII